MALAIGPPFDDTFTADGFGPTEDGVELSVPLQQLTRGPLPAGVDVLAGSNLDEGTEFMSATAPIACNASAAEFVAWAVLQFGPALGPRVVSLYSEPELPAPVCEPSRHPGTAAPGASPQWIGAMRAAGDAAIGCRGRELLYAAQRAGNAGYANDESVHR